MLSFYVAGKVVRFGDLAGLGHTRLDQRILIAQGVELVPLEGYRSVTARVPGAWRLKHHKNRKNKREK